MNPVEYDDKYVTPYHLDMLWARVKGVGVAFSIDDKYLNIFRIKCALLDRYTL